MTYKGKTHKTACIRSMCMQEPTLTCVSYSSLNYLLSTVNTIEHKSRNRVNLLFWKENIKFYKQSLLRIDQCLAHLSSERCHLAMDGTRCRHSQQTLSRARATLWMKGGGWITGVTRVEDIITTRTQSTESI